MREHSTFKSSDGNAYNHVGTDGTLYAQYTGEGATLLIEIQDVDDTVEYT